jgi:predicted transcriptional regulator
LSQIKALDTRAADALLEQHGRVERREKVLPVSTQAAIVRVLDEYASMPNLSEPEAEGLAALSLTYQHGVRPVQLLSMRVEDVNVLRDATGAPVCIVSFHAAKQGEGREFEMVRQVKFEWGSLIEQLLAHAKRARRRRLFSTSMSEKLWFRVKAVCKQKGLIVQFNANSLRHNGAQQLADAGQSRASIQNFLGHSGSSAANAYLKGSRQQSNLLNTALGTSKLYGNILSLAEGNFVSNEEIAQASEDQQIGAVVGDRLVSGVGLCRTGQSHCPYDPVASCYGCNKYMPSLDRSAHEDAVAGMREQVLVFINRGGDVESQAYKQLTHALAGAQHAVEVVDRICGKAK